MTRNISIPEFRTAAPADAALPSADLQALIDGILADTAPIFAAMDWAEEAITAASRRHPGHGDALYHAFMILLPRDIGPGMGTEFVYRGHARELLERVKGPTPALLAGQRSHSAARRRVRPLHADELRAISNVPKCVTCPDTHDPLPPARGLMSSVTSPTP